MVAQEALHDRRRDRVRLAAERLAIQVHEVIDQGGHFGHALAQGRHDDLDDVEPVVEILPESAFGDAPVEILIRRGEDTTIDPQGRFAAHAGELTVLEHVQELGLERPVQIPDLVEEDRAGVRGLELADLQLVRPGERPALVAEQLALEELARDGRAVDLDVWPRPPRRQGMDGSGDHVLARPRLSRDEDGHVHARRLLDDGADLLHPPAVPERHLARGLRGDLPRGRWLPIRRGPRTCRRGPHDPLQDTVEIGLDR